MQTMIDHPSLWVMLAMLSIAAVSDLRTGLIPNAVVAWGAAAGVLAQLTTVVLGQVSLGLALQRIALGLVLGSVLPLVLYRLGALGGGDVKLFAAIGVCVGPLSVVAIELWAHVVALCFVPAQLLRFGTLLATLQRSGRVLCNVFVPAGKRRPMDASSFSSLRFAPAIWLAAIWVCVLGERWP